MALDLQTGTNTGTILTEINDKALDKTGDSMSGSLSMGGNKITDLLTPTNDTDAVNKAYVGTVQEQIQSYMSYTKGYIPPTTYNYVAGETKTITLDDFSSYFLRCRMWGFDGDNYFMVDFDLDNARCLTSSKTANSYFEVRSKLHGDTYLTGSNGWNSIRIKSVCLLPTSPSQIEIVLFNDSSSAQSKTFWAEYELYYF